jgi:hypothetical protein
MRRGRAWGIGCGALLAASGALRGSGAPSQPPPQPQPEAPGASLRAVIVGGGPERDSNQLAICRNVAYVSRLLPPGAPVFRLFADGNAASRSVVYEKPAPRPPARARLFELVFLDREDLSDTVLAYRTPELGKLDGPSRKKGVIQAFQWLKDGPGAPVLLYFTGHGEPAKDLNLNDNLYNLWGGENLSVKALARQVGTLPEDVPVTLVMVQCYAGAFANLLFTGGEPRGAPVRRVITGFFATTSDRMAAGCTPEVNEAEYHDFTSYFFAALSGQDRVGRPVAGADYNQDGRVGKDEAFAYSVAKDHSIDVPVCTSEVFLQLAVPFRDSEALRLPYATLRERATPGQAAALEELSGTLALTGESRSRTAFSILCGGELTDAQEILEARRRVFARAKAHSKRALVGRWPRLRDPYSIRAAASVSQAVAYLGNAGKKTPYRELQEQHAALSRAEEKVYAAEIRQAQALRFFRLAKCIARAHRLRETGPPAVKERFEQLLAAEAAPLW